MSVELKLKTLTPTEIAEVTGGTLEIYGNMNADEEIRFVTHNSKETGDGVLFCAIRGQRVDGSDFIPDAIDAGSRCFLCSRVPDAAKEKAAEKPFCAVIVPETVAAMGALASYYRGFSKAKFIAITGSVGKTSTKDFIYAVASARFATHKTMGNYNSELGMPLSVQSASPSLNHFKPGMPSARGRRVAGPSP